MNTMLANTVGVILKLARFSDGDVFPADNIAGLVDERGRLVVTDREILGPGVDLSDYYSIYRKLEPYVDSVRVFDGRLAVCL